MTSTKDTSLRQTSARMNTQLSQVKNQYSGRGSSWEVAKENFWQSAFRQNPQHFKDQGKLWKSG